MEQHTGSLTQPESPANRLKRRVIVEEPPDDLQGLRDMLGQLWSGRWFIAQAAMVGFILAVAVGLFLPNQYTSTATLLPSGGKSALGSFAAGLGGQLADLGLASAIKGADPSESSELFPNVLRSRTIGDAVMTHRYTISDPDYPEPIDLYQYFGLTNGDYAFRELQALLNIGQDPRTGITSVSATTPFPELSQQITAALLSELETYNRERRQTQGTEKVAFLETRMADVRGELAEAEDVLLVVRAQNMNYDTTTDPDLLAELGRLDREVMIKSKLYALLTQQYEMAKVEATDQTPIIQVLDEPLVPQVKSAPSRRTMAMVVVMLSALIAVLIVLALKPLLALFPDSVLLNRLAVAVPRPFPSQFARLSLGRSSEPRNT